MWRGSGCLLSPCGPGTTHLPAATSMRRTQHIPTKRMTKCQPKYYLKWMKRSKHTFSVETVCCTMNISKSLPGTVWEPAGIRAGLCHHFANRHTQVWKFCVHPREATSGSRRANWRFSTLGPWSVIHYYGLVSKCCLNGLFVLPATHHPHGRPPIAAEGHSWTIMALVSPSFFPQETLQGLDLVISSLPSAFDKCKYTARGDFPLMCFSRLLPPRLCVCS